MKKLFVLAVLASSISSAFAAQETIRLYKVPHEVVKPVCSIFTDMTLDLNGNHGTAKLVNGVTGLCRIMVRPDARTYSIVLSSLDCGAKVYRGKSDGGQSIEITDNRDRTCENTVPALIVVKRESAQGESPTLYSKK